MTFSYTLGGLSAGVALAMCVATSGLADPPLPLPRPNGAGIADLAATAIRSANVPLPRPRPVPGVVSMSAYAQVGFGLRGALYAGRATFTPLVRPAAGPFAIAPTQSTSDADINRVKEVLAYARKGEDNEADAVLRRIEDPIAGKLAEWLILRSHNTNPSFYRYSSFIHKNPSWPHQPLFIRRAENALWNDQLDDTTVLAFFEKRDDPTTAKGRFVLARALLAKGERDRAAALVRRAWRENDFSSDVESQARQMFGDLITYADDKFRMAARFYKDDIGSGTRAAQKLGGHYPAIARAWKAMIEKPRSAKWALDAVPRAARGDAGYIFCRIQWLRRHDKYDEAVALTLRAPTKLEDVVDPDEWWRERRLLVREMLDQRKPKLAYRIARDATPPNSDNYRVDHQFTAGWIALRYLKDPATAAAHFAHLHEGTENPHALGRAGYWQGRAAEALGRRAQARKHYEMAAAHSATYYGQLARARLGLNNLGLHPPPKFTPEERRVLSQTEIARAVEILYAIDERTYIASIFAELGQSGTDIAGMAMLAEIAGKHGDGRAMLFLGKYAHGRGLPLDHYAYPTFGLPDYKPIGPPIEPALAYSIARQESHFNQKVVSHAKAMGLMQVTPAAGIDTAKRFGVKYSRHRLATDPVYNMQMGAAELGMLMKQYDGSYILTFVGYNAGRGRVKQWIAARGDPRDPRVDPIDWVERIPFSETRNYVQRLMENVQVYRARFGGGSRLLIEADINSGHSAN